MHNYSDIFAPLFGRILMGGFFVWNGIQVAINLNSTVDSIIIHGAPMPVTLAVAAIAIEVLGGLALVVGFKTSPAALVLAIYIIFTALFYTGLVSASAQALFLQDMAIVGGLLYISAYGAGSWATDWHYKR